MRDCARGRDRPVLLDCGDQQREGYHVSRASRGEGLVEVEGGVQKSQTYTTRFSASFSSCFFLKSFSALAFLETGGVAKGARGKARGVSQ